ncbi:DUF4350 domain-containing protein [Chloroflexota bacterium]
MLKFWKIALFLLATSFFAENMGFFTHQLNLAIGLICLFIFVILYSPRIDFKEIDKRLVVIGSVIVILVLLLLREELLLRMIGLCIFLFGFDIFLRGVGRQERELPVLLVALIAFTLFMVFFKYTPFLWYLMDNLSLSISKMVNYLAPKDILLGTTFAGLSSVVLFALFLVSAYLFSIKKKLWHLLMFLVSLIFVNMIYVYCYAYLLSFLQFLQSIRGENIEPGSTLLEIPDRYLLNLPIILFIFLLIPLYMYLKRKQFHAIRLMPNKADYKLLAPILVLVALSISAVTMSFPVKSISGAEVAFYEKGFLNWNTPTFEHFGARSAGMFGNLPSFTEKIGLKSRRIDKITENSLSGTKVLVIINIKEEMSQSEVEAIWEFVGDGGSLLVMGDHTFYGQDGKNWLNEILKPVDIKYNFDSADFFIGGWLHSYEYAKHPITHRLSDEENEAGIVVGASLEAKYPAVPIIMGKYGYSDMGDVLNSDGGYLGNLKYDMSEKLGDVVLAAEQKYGQGKVLVFGDTSGFVNSILVNTHPFINRVFTWLASDSTPIAYPIRLALCLVFLAPAVVLFWRTNRNVTTLFFSALVILVIMISAPSIGSWKTERTLTGDIAYVDASHFGRFSLESWREDGTMGLHLNLMRNGYLSFLLKGFSPEKVAGSDLLVLIAPTKPFTRNEVKMLQAYVKNGGRLILTVGWEERSASTLLLEAFNCRLEPVPLGHFKTQVSNTEETAMFYEAWPVYSDDVEAEVLCSYDKYPLISLKDYGKGKFVVVGDSYFLLNKNLEMEDYVYQDNISFLKWLLKKLEA